MSRKQLTSFSTSALSSLARLFYRSNSSPSSSTSATCFIPGTMIMFIERRSFFSEKSYLQLLSELNIALISASSSGV